MKKLRKLRIYGMFLLAFTFTVSVSSCDIMLEVLEEMAEYEEQNDNGGGGSGGDDDGGSKGKKKDDGDDGSTSKGKRKSDDG